MLLKRKFPLGKEITYCYECTHRTYDLCPFRRDRVTSNGFCDKGSRTPVVVHCKDCVYHADFFPVCTYEPQLRFVQDNDTCFKGEEK